MLPGWQPRRRPRYPQRIGDFTLERTWNETQFGVLVYSWGEYAEPTVNGIPGAHVMLGVSPQTVHDAEVCHLARRGRSRPGTDRLWQQPRAARWS